MTDTTDLRPSGGDNPWYKARPVAPEESPAVGPAEGDAGLPGDHHLAADAAWVAGGAGTGDTRNSTPRVVVALLVVAVSAYLFGPYAFLIIGALLVSIILHEFGHYGTAKLFGMKATEFFVGFGPRIWSFRRGETEYGLKVIPAGAYVRIIGMNNLEDVDPADESRAYRSKSAPKRMIVVLAGPFMNLMIAFVLLFSLLLFHGAPGDGWTVGKVQAGSAAAAAGVKEGDRIVTVGGEPVGSWEHFREQLNAKSGAPVDFVVDRGGQQVTLTADLGWRLSADSAKAIPSKPVLKAADLVRSVADQPVASYDDLRQVLEQSGDPVTLKLERNGQPYELIVNRPVAGLPSNGSGAYLGVGYEPILVKEGAGGAVTGSLVAMRNILAGTGSAFGRLFTPAGLQDYAGQVADSTHTTTTLAASTEVGVLTPIGSAPAPDAAAASERPVSIVGIVRLGNDVAKVDLWQFVELMAAVNFALAIINLVPLLPFDGGHAVIAAYEGIRGAIQRKPYRADITKMLPIVYGVFALLVLLGSTSILLDILRPPTIP